jgi:hypothetical protein
MTLSKFLIKSFIKKSVKKTAQAASWLPAINMKLQSMAYLAGYKVTKAEILQSTGWVAEEISFLFKRFAEDAGPPPLPELEELTEWYLADIAFAMEVDARKLSLLFNQFSVFFERVEKQREEMEDFEEVSWEDIQAESNLFDINMNRKSPR